MISKEIAKANAALHDADQKRNRILVSHRKVFARLAVLTKLPSQNQGRAIQQEKSKLQREKERLEELSKEEAPQEVAGLEAVRDEHVNTKEQLKVSFKIVSFHPGCISRNSYHSLAGLRKEAPARWREQTFVGEGQAVTRAFGQG